MDNGQNDMISKLLSDPKNLALIAGIAKNFMESGNPKKEVVPESTVDNDASQESALNNADDVQENIIQNHPPHFTERENLLRSIKPYLKAERQPKVDSLLKALDIARIISTYTGNNL